jgi:hypothetical protein
MVLLMNVAALFKPQVPASLPVRIRDYLQFLQSQVQAKHIYFLGAKQA